MKLKINEDQPNNKKNEAYDRLRANAEYLAKIDRSIAELERGEGKIHELIEVDDE